MRPIVDEVRGYDLEKREVFSKRGAFRSRRWGYGGGRSSKVSCFSASADVGWVVPRAGERSMDIIR